MEQECFKMDALRGGSPYGAGVFLGDHTREPTKTKLTLVEHLGKYMALMAKRFALPHSFTNDHKDSS